MPKHIPGVMTNDKVIDSDLTPEEWRREIFNIVPAGQTPLVALLNNTPSEATPSRTFHWWSYREDEQRGDIIDVHADAGFVNQYSSGGVVGSSLFLACTAEVASQMIPGYTILIINDDTLEEVPADVIGVEIRDDTTSYIAVQLLAADTGSALAGDDLSFWIAGDAQHELSPLPIPKNEEEEQWTNQTQIMAEAIAASGSKLAEIERITPDFWTRQRKYGLMRMKKRLEKTIHFGEFATKKVNKLQKRFTRGLVPAIRTYYPENILNFKTDPGYAGQPWEQGGYPFLMNTFERLFRYTTAGRKVCYCGHTAMQAIQDMVMDYGHLELKTRQTSIGLTINQLVTPFGPVDIMTTPLYTQHPSRLGAMLVTEPGLLKLRPLRGRDLTFLPDVNKDKGGFEAVDGTMEGWRIEFGLEYNNLEAMAYITNLGADNAVAA